MPASDQANNKMDVFPVPFKAVATVLATVLLVALGALNVRDRVRWQDPTDGVFWVETGQGLVAGEVEPGGPGASAGIETGDTLLSINGEAIGSLGRYSDMLYDLGIGGRATYLVGSGSGSLRALVEIGGRRFFRPSDSLKTLLALTYLVIGLFVLYRGGRQPRAYHFFLICLAAFVVFLYSFTPALRPLDWIVYFFSIGAFLVLPALFVHLCLRFPFDLVDGRSLAPLLYLPAALLGAVQVLWLAGHLAPLGLARTGHSQLMLERAHLVYFCLGFLSGGVILWFRRRLAGDFITRQQMKWVSHGTLAGIIPFSLIYGVPWLFGVRTNEIMLTAQLFLALIPLSFAYAIVRYRLIDVEAIVRRSMAYFLASFLLLALYVLFVLGVGKALEWAAPEADFVAVTLAALAIALLFAPLRNAIQLRLDRYFYKDRFDDRAGLLEFARTLSTEISLDRLSRRILEKVRQTFRVEKAALFLLDPSRPGCFRVQDALGIEALRKISPLLREDELYQSASGPAAGSGEAGLQLRPSHAMLQEDGIDHLQDLRLRGRCIGAIGLGGFPPGSHMSSEDLALLQALADYAAIALENANLYRSIETKALEMQRLREYMENIIESINIAVMALDLQGRITACNRAFESLYGVPRAEAKGRPVEEVLPADVIASLHNACGSTAWDRGAAANIFKLFMQSRSGERLIVNMSLIPLLDPTARNSGSLIVIDDVTGKVRLEEQLLQAEKLSSLGLMAAGLAHEVNTPITGISSYAQMLLKGMPDSDARKPILEKIEKQTFRAAEIVNGLLNFARMNGTDFSEVDLNRLIRESLNLLDHQLRHSHIEVEPQLDTSVPRVYGNAGKLQQVFVNLFLNAKDAMPSGGRLRVETRRDDGVVEVEISDTGVGISEESIKRIFDPFFTTKRAGKGTGLGLAITYGIIQEHGGRIFVESAPHQGTHFRLELPAREAVRA